MVLLIYILILFRQVEEARLLHSKNDTENKRKKVQTRLQHPWRSSGRSKKWLFSHNLFVKYGHFHILSL